MTSLQCPACRYELTALHGRVALCPECGQGIQWNDPALQHSRSRAAWRPIPIIALPFLTLAAMSSSLVPRALGLSREGCWTIGLVAAIFVLWPAIHLAAQFSNSLSSSSVVLRGSFVLMGLFVAVMLIAISLALGAML